MFVCLITFEVPLVFRVELIRVFIGVGLAAIPLAVFGNDWPQGTIAGCVAAVALIVLSLTSQRKDIRPVCVVLVYQVACMFLSSLFCALFFGAISTPFEVTFFNSLYFGAAVGGLWGFFANAVERQDARCERARIEACEIPADDSADDADSQLENPSE